MDFRDTDSTSETADAPQTAGFACPSATRRPFRPLQHRSHCRHSTHRQGNHRLRVHPRSPPHTTNEPWSLHDQGSHKTIVAVAAGFEPAVAINHTAFRVLHLRPLGHATADYRSGITPRSATRQPVGRDTSPGCASITEPMPGSTRPKHTPSRRAAHSPHAADVVPVFRFFPRRRRPAYAEPSRLRDLQRFPHAVGAPRAQSRPVNRPTRTPAETQTAPESVRRRRQTPWPTAASAQSQQTFHRPEEI